MGPDGSLPRHVGDFLRLAGLAGDRHYRDIATLLLHNTKQRVQVGDEFGYRVPGSRSSTGRPAGPWLWAELGLAALGVHRARAGHLGCGQDATFVVLTLGSATF